MHRLIEHSVNYSTQLYMNFVNQEDAMLAHRIRSSMREIEEHNLALRNKEEISKQLRVWYEYFFICSLFLLMLKIILDRLFPLAFAVILLLAYETT